MIPRIRQPGLYTQFISNLFEEEGHELFDVRQAILGHLQQGGDPSPYDRIQAIRLATLCLDDLISKAEGHSKDCTFIGLQAGSMKFHNLEDFMRMVDEKYQRPKDQWWLSMRPIARLLAQPGPGEEEVS
jgi:6-phosphofructokinase 1